MTDKYQCIADFLEIDIDDLEKEDYEHYGLEVYNGFLAVGTDEEVNIAAKKCIKDSLWAYKAKFLAEQTGLSESIFKKLPKCKKANNAILALIEKTCGLEDFTHAAIDADGRGHLLASCDGKEDYEHYIDERWGEQELYFYRID